MGGTEGTARTLDTLPAPGAPARAPSPQSDASISSKGFQPDPSIVRRRRVPIQSDRPSEMFVQQSAIVGHQSSSAGVRTVTAAMLFALGALIGFPAGYLVARRTPVGPATSNTVERAAEIASTPSSPSTAKTPGPASPRPRDSSAVEAAATPAAATDVVVAPVSPSAPISPSGSSTSSATSGAPPPPFPGSAAGAARDTVRARTERADVAVGALSVSSRPAGARVFVDGRLAGVTPLLLSNVKPGTHQVRIERSGYARWTTAVRVAPSRRSRVSASLEPR